MKKLFFIVTLILTLTSCDSGETQQSGVYYERAIPSNGYPQTGGYNVSFQGGEKTGPVETTAACSECGCTGYEGTKHYLSGSYEGDCTHSDGWGHTCGHSPKEHGLKQW